MKIWKKNMALAVVMAVTIAILPAQSFAGELPGRNLEEKLDNAGYDIYRTMKLLLDSYMGEDITAEMLYDAAIDGMTWVLDEYSVYFKEDEYMQFKESLSGHVMGIGVVLGLSENNDIIIRQVLEKMPAELSGVMHGDVIVGINGQEVKGLSLEEVSFLINNSETATVNIDLTRDGEAQSFAIRKTDIKIESVKMERFEDIFDFADENDNSKIRYMLIDSFVADTASDFKECLNRMTEEGVTGLVLDLRGNPGGYLEQVIEICEVLVPKGPIMYTLDSKGAQIVRQSMLETVPIRDIYVLTDENTASAAEIITAALQDSKAAQVIGNVTYGKGVIQGSVPSLTNGAVKFTYMEYLRRSGKKINKIGVTPDIMVEQPKFVSNNISFDSDNVSDELPALKQILSYLGYAITNYSKVYDDDTRKQVMLFQETNNLEVTGELDYATVRAINYALYNVYVQSDIVLETAYQMLLAKKSPS